MNERIKQIRKELGFTQEEFAKRIGIKRNTLANYEIGRNEPIDAVIFSICREFKINEDWLRNGVGDKDVKVPQEDEYFKAATQIAIDKDELAMQAIIDYWKMDPVFKKEFKKYILGISKKITE